MGDALQTRVHIAAVSEIVETGAAQVADGLGWWCDFFGRYHFDSFASDAHFFEAYFASVDFGLFRRDGVLQQCVPSALLLLFELKFEFFGRDLEGALLVADAVEELCFPFELSLNAACFVAVSSNKCFIA